MREPSDAIPSYVAELFEAERQAPRPSAEVERRVRGRVAASLCLTAAGATSLAASSAAASAVAVSAKAGGLALAIKASMVVVGVGVLGTASGIAWRNQMARKPKPESPTHVVASHPRSAPGKAAGKPRPEIVEAPARPEMPALPEPVRPLQSAPAADPGAKAPGRPTRAREAVAWEGSNEPGRLAEESSLLDKARASLETRYPAQALALLDEHKRRFPHGQLEEEREALWVQALVASGSLHDARARAVEFRRRFPRGIQLPVVKAAVLSID